MARKAGLYITAPIEALLLGREDQDSLSGRISTIAERYSAMCAAHMPELAEAEWMACCDALNGVWQRDALSLRAVWAEIADADRLDGLGVRWSIDAQALSIRVRDMSTAEIVALVEAVEQWWAEQAARK